MATWSSLPIGPDGPWQAVEVTTGNDDTMALYPGHLFQSWVVTTDYCKFNKSDGCYASKAGTYNVASSTQDGTGTEGGVMFDPPLNEFMFGMDVRGEESASWTGTIDAGAEVEDVSLVLIESQFAAYPNGQWYPIFAGCLGIGAPGAVNQTFTGNGPQPINASLIPGRLWELEEIHSNSFGMHIGSVSSQMPGSLWWGGFDQNRVIGDVLSTEYNKDDTDGAVLLQVSLQDIGIEVIQGHSPFNFTDKQGGLLADKNDTTRDSLPVIVDGCSPYLTLPKSTCDNIAAHLPVTYSQDLGLYLWDTSSPQYAAIVSSASALTFTFLPAKGNDTNIDSLTIRVPFPHLNLTLARPLVEDSTPYFPCFTGGQGKFVLGRAFLQDAFLGANWEKSKWWLAQAPGPSIQESLRPVVIESYDKDIESADDSWEYTWKGAWNALTEEEASGSQSVEPPEPTGGTDAGRSGGISAGAKAGIGVGATVGALAIVGALVVYWHRRRPRRPSSRQVGLGERNDWQGLPEYSLDDMRKGQNYVTEVQGSNLPHGRPTYRKSGRCVAEVQGTEPQRHELWAERDWSSRQSRPRYELES